MLFHIFPLYICIYRFKSEENSNHLFPLLWKSFSRFPDCNYVHYVGDTRCFRSFLAFFYFSPLALFTFCPQPLVRGPLANIPQHCNRRLCADPMRAQCEPDTARAKSPCRIQDTTETPFLTAQTPYYSLPVKIATHTEKQHS